MRPVCLLILLLAVSNHVCAISEGPQFQSTFDRIVSPFLTAHLKFDQFQSRDHQKIVYARLTLPHSKGTIVISPGRSESIVGFSETIYDLASSGYSVAILDHRGQGFSQRAILNSDIGYVGRFDEYSDDFSDFVDHHVMGQMPAPLFLMANSMGAAIALTSLETHSSTFAAALIAVPMLQINTAPFPPVIANIVAWTLSALGGGIDYVPDAGPYNFKRAFSENDFTHSRDRFDIELRLTKEHPQIAVGGASVNWFIEATSGADALRSRAREIMTPILMVQADEDAYVMNAAEDRFCREARDCRLLQLKSARHSVFVETDRVRKQVLSAAGNFFDAHSGAPAAAPKSSPRE